MAPELICGAECGIVTLGLGATGVRHWSLVTGTPAIETSIVRSGSRSFRFAAAATVPSLSHSTAGSRPIGWMRLYFYPTTITPSSDCTIIYLSCSVGASDIYIKLKTTGVLEASWAGSDPQSSAAGSIVANQWNGVEVEGDVTTNPNLIRWRTYNQSSGWVNQTTASRAIAGTFIGGTNGLNFGMVQGPTSGITIYMDDVMAGTAAVAGTDWKNDAPAHGRVLRVLPTSDGAHSFTANDFAYNTAGAAFASSVTDVWSYVDDSDQTSLADGVLIRQAVVRATGYVAVRFADTVERAVRAVAVTSTHHSSTTGANTHSLRVSDNNWTNETALLTLEDISDTSAHFRHLIVATPPSGGTWTPEKLNSTEVRWGYSTDVVGIPYWDSVSIEYEAPELWIPPSTVYPQILRQ